MYMSQVFTYLGTLLAHQHSDKAGSFFIAQLSALTSYCLVQLIQIIDLSYYQGPLLVLLLTNFLLLIFIAATFLTRNRLPYRLLQCLGLNLFLAAQLFLSPINPPLQNCLLTALLWHYFRCPVLKISSAAQLILYCAVEGTCIFTKIHSLCLLAFILSSFILRAYRRLQTLKAERPHQDLLQYCQLLLQLLQNDKYWGIYIPQVEQYLISSHQDQSSVNLQEDAHLKSYPITLHQAPDQLLNFNSEKLCMKTKFTNLHQLLDKYDSITFYPQDKIIAKLDKSKPKYRLRVKPFELNHTKCFLIQYVNDTEYSRNDTKTYKLAKLQQLLISALTHKLKTPLSAAIAHLQTAINDETIQSQIKIDFIQPSLQNCQLQLYQVQDIIEYLLKDFETLQPIIQRVDLLPTIQKVIEIISTSCRSKQINFKFTFNNDDPPHERYFPVYVYTDETKLIRILINLLNNAYRFTSAGGFIKLDLSLILGSARPESETQYSFTVEDSGSGMTEDQFDLISRELSQGSRKLSQSAALFSGISLSITNALVKMLNNSNLPLILLKSDQNGTKFSFMIENIIDSLKQLKFTSIANIDNYRSHRSISVSQMPQSSLLKNKSQLQVSCFASKHTSQKLSIKQDISSTNEISDEPSGQRLLKIPINHHNKSLISHKSMTHRHDSPRKSMLSQKSLLQQIDMMKINKGGEYKILRKVPSANHLLETTENSCVVIVDDEPFNHVSLTLLLKKIGVENIISCYNGQEALDLIARIRDPIKAVLMDVDMPIMDGITIISGHWKDNMMDVFPIIACTAHQDVNTYQRCLDAGMVGVLTKPVFIKQLVEIMKLLEYQEASSNQMLIG